MKSKSLILAMFFTATGLLTLSGCKLSEGDFQEEINETEMRYMNENGDFRMPDNGIGFTTRSLSRLTMARMWW